jgi:hypothetical protein
MGSAIRWIRLLTAVIAGVMACAFAQFYSSFFKLTLEFGHPLPTITLIVLKASRYAYVIPAILFLAGVYFLRKRTRGIVGLELIISIGWILTIFWSLFAIWAWVLAKIEMR